MQRILQGVLCVAMLLAGCSRPAWQDQVPKQVQALFTEHGWAITGNVAEQVRFLPLDVAGAGTSITAPPWVWLLGLSKGVGLDFQPYAGQEVTFLTFDLKDAGRKRLTEYKLNATVLLHETKGVIGAWICAPEQAPGEFKAGEFRCFSLEGVPRG